MFGRIPKRTKLLNGTLSTPAAVAGNSNTRSPNSKSHSSVSVVRIWMLPAYLPRTLSCSKF